MSYKMTLFRFTRTASVMDLRADAATQMLDDRRKRAVSYMCANRNFGRATFE